MIESHELADLTAALGEPHLEQRTNAQGEGARTLFYWGCGCTGIETGERSEGSNAVRWSRCDHHAAAERASV
ncbi:MAG TPA: hypothetical protein VHT05_10540 [Candidatus Elarobacter sp.]|jgi:hypothetical protein|nr:hypothetical protein [Candidatus Elarobacter sp.]